jgi:hypothetical protein
LCLPKTFKPKIVVFSKTEDKLTGICSIKYCAASHHAFHACKIELTLLKIFSFISPPLHARAHCCWWFAQQVSKEKVAFTIGAAGRIFIIRGKPVPSINIANLRRRAASPLGEARRSQRISRVEMY